MNIYLFAIASLILISPIFLFLPIGLTKKGKVIVIITSFLIAVLGLTATSAFQWWQFISLMLLLVLLSSFLLDKKMQHILYAENSTDVIDSNPFDEAVEEKFLKDLSLEERTNFHKKEVSETETTFAEIESFISNEDTNIFEAVVEVEVKEEIEIEDIIDNPLDDLLETPDGISEDTYEDEEFIHCENKEPHIEVIDDLESKEDLSYMSELEKLIFETDDNLEQEIAHVNMVDASNEDQFEELVNEVLEVDDDEALMNEVLEADEYIEIITQFENHVAEAAPTLDSHLEVDETEEVINEILHENVISELDILSETFESLENELSPMIIEESQEVLVDNSAEELLRKQIFRTLLAQVELAKKTTEKAQYEKFILACMHPNMPKLEYYTFARLLFQHYVSTKEYEKLHNLLNNLESKYNDFPVVLQEVQFLQAYYPNVFVEK